MAGYMYRNARISVTWPENSERVHTNSGTAIKCRSFYTDSTMIVFEGVQPEFETMLVY